MSDTRRNVAFHVISCMLVGEWITRAWLCDIAGVSHSNKTVASELKRLADEGYLYEVSLAQFHKNARTIVYVRTSKGFVISRVMRQLDMFEGWQ